MRPQIHDDDKSQITITVGDKPVKSWTYTKEDERVQKMRQAQSWCDGFTVANAEAPQVEPVGDGGNAFPSQSTRDGMTLRDWLAGQALTGVMLICANDTGYHQHEGSGQGYLAAQAYGIADAMLKARSR